MSVEIVTMWYNESFLSHFFLNHYSYAEKITVLFDNDTNDDTLSILQQYKNVQIIPFKFPSGLDDDIKIAMMTEQYKQSKCDWVVMADSDEFVFIREKNGLNPDIRRYLDKTSRAQVHNVPLCNVYRHCSDADLDASLSAVPQRRHGDANIFASDTRRYYKPMIAKRGLDIIWEPGCHSIINAAQFSIAPKYQKYAWSRNILKKARAVLHFHLAGGALMGAHWASADPDFAIERIVKNRKSRQSANNLEKNYGNHYNRVTAEAIRAECIKHQHDPLLF